MAYDRRYMVKQHLTRLFNKFDGRAFDVFNSGENGWVLFVPIIGHDRNGLGGFQGDLQIPVRRKDLRIKLPR